MLHFPGKLAPGEECEKKTDRRDGGCVAGRRLVFIGSGKCTVRRKGNSYGCGYRRDAF